jgi:hypothetical protein
MAHFSVYWCKMQVYHRILRLPQYLFVAVSGLPNFLANLTEGQTPCESRSISSLIISSSVQHCLQSYCLCFHSKQAL